MESETNGRMAHILLANIIKWINKASLELYIARTLRAMPRPNECLETLWCCQIRLLWLKFVIVEVERQYLSEKVALNIMLWISLLI